MILSNFSQTISFYILKCIQPYLSQNIYVHIEQPKLNEKPMPLSFEEIMEKTVVCC